MQSRKSEGCKMSISVVMATFNGEDYIEKQLDSILGQSLVPDEIIICDDCSEDSTSMILEQYLNRYFKNAKVSVRVFNNEKRLGYALNFRKAIEASNGDVVFLSDQDDIWHKDKIKKCMDILIKHPEMLALSTGYDLIDEKGDLLKSPFYKYLFNLNSSIFQKLFPITKIKFKSFIKHPRYPGMAMVFRRRLWDIMKYEGIIDWRYKPAHDWALNFSAAVHEGMYFYAEKMILYRQHRCNSAGILYMQKKENLYVQRVNIIKSLINNFNSVGNCGNEIREKVNAALQFQIKRLKLINRGSIFKLICSEIMNLRFISLKSIAGDMYVLLKRGNICIK